MQDLLPQFPGRLIDAELPKLPRPEIGKVLASSIFGKQSIFHPALETPRRQQELITLMRSIQKHVLENRLNVPEFFKVSIYPSVVYTLWLFCYLHPFFCKLYVYSIMHIVSRSFRDGVF